MSKKSNSDRLKRMTRKAKAIRRKRPGMSWISALREAGKATSRKRSSRSRKVKKHVRRSRALVTHSAQSAGDSLASLLSKARSAILDRIGDKERQKFATRLKVDKRRIAREISALKSQYRKLK
jgi:hypothetical protein